MLSTNTGAGVRLFGAELFSLANEASTSTEEDKIEEEYDDKNLSDYADYDDDDSDGEEESGRRNMLGGEWIPGQGSVQSPRYSTGGRGRGRPVGGRRSGRR